MFGRGRLGHDRRDGQRPRFADREPGEVVGLRLEDMGRESALDGQRPRAIEACEEQLLLGATERQANLPISRVDETREGIETLPDIEIAQSPIRSFARPPVERQDRDGPGALPPDGREQPERVASSHIVLDLGNGPARLLREQAIEPGSREAGCPRIGGSLRGDGQQRPVQSGYVPESVSATDAHESSDVLVAQPYRQRIGGHRRSTTSTRAPLLATITLLPRSAMARITTVTATGPPCSIETTV